MRRYALCTLALIAFLLAGCATTQSYERSLITACNAYAGALTTAASARADMSQSQVDAVNATREIVNPICTADDMPDTREALNHVLDATATVTQINGREQ